MRRTQLHERRLRPTAAPSRLSRCFLWLLAIFLLRDPWLDAQSTCGNTAVTLTPDYQFAVGTSSGGGAYTWTLNGQAIAQGGNPQMGLFHYDNSLASTSGIAPKQSVGTSFVPGKWGSALAIANAGILSYPASGNVSFADGTIELWAAPTKNGTDPIYSQHDHTLFRYTAANGDQLVFSESAHGGFYAGTIIGNTYTGVGGIQIASLTAGIWHHVAFTYSKANSRRRMYLDGALVGESGVAFSMPAADGTSFTIDSDPYGNASAFLVDELRISSDEKTAAQIQYDAARSTPTGDNEVFLSLNGVSPGQLTFSVSGCGGASYAYTGVPIGNFSPATGLLPPGSNSVALTFTTTQPTVCRYSVGNALAYTSMQPLDTGAPTTTHKAIAAGISSDPRVQNQVYVRCASNTDYLQSATYRTVAAPGQAFPRIGNIWIGDYVYQNKPAQAKKIQLYLGPYGLSTNDANAIRSANPNVLILPSINVADNGGEGSPPDNYYLKDIHGNKIADWCGTLRYLLNVTKPEVALFFGQYAYQQLAQSGFAFDGLFFDSFGTTIPQPFTDCYGNIVQIDSNGDGVADDPTALNAAWSAGEYSVVSAFHDLAPNAYVSGHVLEVPPQAPSLRAFNGTSIEFHTQSVRDGDMAFGTLWNMYQSWETQGVPPAMRLIQSCPPNQLSYGYGYFPLKALLPATAAFAQGFYPNMRFGLGLTLMGDGFFMYDFGDAAPPMTWWYDEYDFNLGYPIGPAARIGNGNAAKLIDNGGFERSLAGTWQLNVFNDGHGKATAALDASIAADGNSSAHVTIASAGTVNWHISFEQENLPVVAGTSYQVQFWARADSPRVITVFSQGGAPNYTNYGLSAQISIDTTWRLYSAAFSPPVSANDARLEFWVGDVAGNVWIDDVQVSPASAEIYRRDYTNGVVLLNGTSSQQAIPLEAGLRRFSGSQAPLYQYILDDSDTGFSFTGAWNAVTYNTGAYSGAGSSVNLPAEPQNANGPYYHCWQGGCHQLDSASGTAQWNLGIPADGPYTIQAWLPAAPKASTWTRNAVYEVVSGGSVIASAMIDQTTAGAGDAWHMIATVNLTAAGSPFVRVHNAGSGSLIADAVYVTSSALYNDGSAATQVTLAALDGILLQRQQPVAAPASRVSSVVNASSYQPAIASAGFVSIFGTGFASSARSWGSSDFSGGKLPVSLDGVSVTINGKAAYVEYISPTQINAIAPDDDTIGPVPVQVTTPQGASYSGTVLKQKLSPAFFTYQSGASSYAAAVHVDGTLVGPNGPSSRPAAPGEVIEVYGTGFGATTPATPTAQLVAQSAPLALPVTMSIGGVAADVQWAGLVLAGLYQFNVKIPNVAAGDQQVQTAVGGFQSPAVMLSIAGQ